MQVDKSCPNLCLDFGVQKHAMSPPGWLHSWSVTNQCAYRPRAEFCSTTHSRALFQRPSGTSPLLRNCESLDMVLSTLSQTWGAYGIFCQNWALNLFSVASLVSTQPMKKLGPHLTFLVVSPINSHTNHVQGFVHQCDHGHHSKVHRETHLPYKYVIKCFWSWKESRQENAQTMQRKKNDSGFVFLFFSSVLGETLGAYFVP